MYNYASTFSKQSIPTDPPGHNHASGRKITFLNDVRKNVVQFMESAMRCAILQDIAKYCTIFQNATHFVRFDCQSETVLPFI